jgi:hypothetical protein
VQALLDGVPGSRVKDRMAALAVNDKRPLAGSGLLEITLVAGAYNHLCRTFMAWQRRSR